MSVDDDGVSTALSPCVVVLFVRRPFPLLRNSAFVSACLVSFVLVPPPPLTSIPPLPLLQRFVECSLKAWLKHVILRSRGILGILEIPDYDDRLQVPRR